MEETIDKDKDLPGSSTPREARPEIGDTETPLTRISASLPRDYQRSLSSFLVHDVENHEVIIVADGFVSRVEIASATGGHPPRRLVDEDRVEDFVEGQGNGWKWVRDKDEVERLTSYISQQAQGSLGGLAEAFFYRVQLESYETDLVRVRAFVDQRVGEWTIDAGPSAREAKWELATSQR